VSETRYDFAFPVLAAGINQIERAISDGGLLRPPTSSELKSASNALDENLYRVFTLAKLPEWLTELTTRHQLIVDWAMFNLTGTPFPQTGQRPSPEAAYTEKCRLADVFRQPDGPSLITLPRPGMSADEVGRESFGLNNLVGTLSLFSDTWIAVAIQSLYSALVIGAYTAFEMAATDIWLAAVNARPRTLAARALEFGRGAESHTKAQEPSVPLATLAEYDFDISRNVGEYLRESRRVSFDSLKGIDAAYKAAFRIPEDREKRISNVLTDLFRESNADLKALEAVRNLFAHRGGKTDERFRAQIRGYDEEWYASPLGEPVRLDGAHVAKFVTTTVRFSSSLLAFVDDWLSTYTDYGRAARDGSDYSI
jgi:hypothetical protein